DSVAVDAATGAVLYNIITTPSSILVRTTAMRNTEGRSVAAWTHVWGTNDVELDGQRMNVATWLSK
ncbi:hypothetical protein BD413DRAFT_478157, partial [Trametes elegans]